MSRFTKLIGLLIVIGLVSLVVSACGSAPAAPKEAATEAPKAAATEAPKAAATEAPKEAATEAPAASQPSAEKVKITFWHHTYTVATDWMRQQVTEYQKTHPNVDIEIVEYPHGDYEVKLRAAIAAGNPPDIINMLDYLFPEFYKNKWLAPVDPASFGVADQQGVIDAFEKPALEGMTFDGKVYGVPAEFNTFVLFMNKKHFQEVGLDAEALSKEWMDKPISWDEFFTLAQKLEKKDDSGNITRMGFNWVWRLDPFWYAQQFWNVTQQYGCEILDKDGKAAINSPACVAAFTDTWYRLVKDKMGGPDLATANPVYAFQDFMDERQSICMGGPWAPAAWRENAPAVYENFVVAPIPQKDPANPKSFIHTYALAVSANSKVQKESWEFLNFLLSKPGEMYSVAGYINGRQGIFDSSELKEALRGIDVYKKEYATGSFVWRSETWAQEGDIIKKAIEEFMQDGDVQGALDRAATEINKVRGK
ncbi:MAG: sugar ABC transporter substrate-binding protein [Anaerolineae bacterium]